MCVSSRKNRLAGCLESTNSPRHTFHPVLAVLDTGAMQSTFGSQSIQTISSPLSTHQGSPRATVHQLLWQRARPRAGAGSPPAPISCTSARGRAEGLGRVPWGGVPAPPALPGAVVGPGPTPQEAARPPGVTGRAGGPLPWSCLLSASR